jgi:hypothetical protein
MDKNQVITAFNEHFMDFIRDIERVFPENTDVSSTRKSLTRLLTLMPKQTILKNFHEHFTSVYSEKIDAGDLIFFTEADYRNNMVFTNKDAIALFEKIDCLREPIRNMSDDDKQKVVKYLQNLKQLTNLYVDIKQQKKN